MRIIIQHLKGILTLPAFGALMSCSHTIDDEAVPGAVIPLSRISPGIDNSDWSNAQSKAAWREYERDRNVEEHPFR